MFEEKRDNFFYRLTEFFEQNFEPKTLLILFFAGVIGNLVLWLAVLFVPERIADIFTFLNDLSDKVSHYLVIFPFFFSFLMAFSVCKYLFRKKDTPIVADQEFLNGYSAHLVKENLRRVFLISFIVAGFNTILIVISTF